MIGAVILAHLVGDYLLQTRWMALEKTKRMMPAVVHGVVYTLPFLFITQSWLALLVISGTHVVIDRYRLAKYFVWAKNRLGPKEHRSEQVGQTGQDEDPVWLSTWLLFITDNSLHLLINVAAIQWL